MIKIYNQLNELFIVSCLKDMMCVVKSTARKAVLFLLQ